MQARGPLMVEHRLIERMLSVIKDTLVKIETTHKVDPVFVDTAVDFIRFEDQEMLAEFWEFDRKMIHEKYESVVEGLKASTGYSESI